MFKLKLRQLKESDLGDVYLNKDDNASYVISDDISLFEKIRLTS